MLVADTRNVLMQGNLGDDTLMFDGGTINAHGGQGDDWISVANSWNGVISGGPGQWTPSRPIGGTYTVLWQSGRRFPDLQQQFIRHHLWRPGHRHHRCQRLWDVSYGNLAGDLLKVDAKTQSDGFSAARATTRFRSKTALATRSSSGNLGNDTFIWNFKDLGNNAVNINAGVNVIKGTIATNLVINDLQTDDTLAFVNQDFVGATVIDSITEMNAIATVDRRRCRRDDLAQSGDRGQRGALRGDHHPGRCWRRFDRRFRGPGRPRLHPNIRLIRTTDRVKLSSA